MASVVVASAELWASGGRILLEEAADLAGQGTAGRGRPGVAGPGTGGARAGARRGQRARAGAAGSRCRWRWFPPQSHPSRPPPPGWRSG